MNLSTQFQDINTAYLRDCGSIADLNCIQHTDNAGMPQSAQLMQGIFCKWESTAVCTDIKGEYGTAGAIFLLVVGANQLVQPSTPVCGRHTRFVPLYRVQIEFSTCSCSPKVYGNGGAFEMADATADLRNSMSRESMD